MKQNLKCNSLQVFRYTCSRDNDTYKVFPVHVKSNSGNVLILGNTQGFSTWFLYVCIYQCFVNDTILCLATSWHLLVLCACELVCVISLGAPNLELRFANKRATSLPGDGEREYSNEHKGQSSFTLPLPLHVFNGDF